VLKIVENLWAVGALPRTTLRELTLTALPRLLAGGEGVAAPSPGTLSPVLDPNEKSWGCTPLCSVARLCTARWRQLRLINHKSVCDAHEVGFNSNVQLSDTL